MAPVLIYELIGWKREIFAYYQQALGDLPGIEFMPETPYGKSNRWLTVILITPEEFGVDRETVRLALEAENIEARPIWKPMHLQPCFAMAEGSKLKAESKSKNTWSASSGEIRSDKLNARCCDSVNLTRQAVVNMPQLNIKDSKV